jgi:hypothetical protein
MQKNITVSVEGPGANRALDEFLAIAGIVGEEQRADPRRVTRSPEVLTAIGTIAGFVGTIAPIVAAILDWRERWKRAHDNRRLNVVIEDANGNRISLDQATPDQITDVIQSLQG